MSTLLQKVNAIKSDKDTNLIPENLKAGVTCLGVTGTYEGGGSGGEHICHFIKTYTPCTVYITTELSNEELITALFDNQNINAKIYVENHSSNTVSKITVNDYSQFTWREFTDVAPGESRCETTSSFSFGMLVCFSASYVS